jgi:hypothetical protein
MLRPSEKWRDISHLFFCSHATTNAPGALLRKRRKQGV